MVTGRVRSCFFLVLALLASGSGCGSSKSQANSGSDAGSSAHAGAAAGAQPNRGGAESGGSAGANGAPIAGAATSGTGAGGAAGANAAGGAAGNRARAGAGSSAAGAGPESSGAGGAGDAEDTGEAGAGGADRVPPVEIITKTIAIVSDSQGQVTPESNGIGIRGNWFADNDCRTSPGDCTTDHVIGPTLGEVAFDTRPFPTASGEVCMRGLTASVNADSEYGAKWGVRWVLPLNEGPNGELRPYDAAARGIGAFGVEVRLRGASMVDSSIRIALLVEGVDDTHSREFYGLTRSSDSFVAEFKRVKQGNGAVPFSVFDASRITAIEITLPTRMGLRLPFDLCVTRVLAVPASLYEPDLSAAPEVPAGTQLVPLTMSADGSVLPNAAGIEGHWFAENDCTTSPLDCTADQTPAPGDPFPVEGSRACATGVVDPVGPSTEYATKWGAAIGLYLNRPQAAALPGLYDAVAKRVVGFTYKLRTYNIEPIRTEAISEGVAEPHLYEATQSAVQTMRFTSLRQGDWVTARTTLDTTKLLAFRFHVPSGPGVVRNFDFCVEELAAIVLDP